MAYNLVGTQDFDIKLSNVYTASLDETFYLVNNESNVREVDIYKLSDETGVFEFVKTVDFIVGLYSDDIVIEYNKIIMVKDEKTGDYIFNYFDSNDRYSYSRCDSDFNLISSGVTDHDIYDNRDTILQFYNENDDSLVQVGENYGTRRIYLSRLYKYNVGEEQYVDRVTRSIILDDDVSEFEAFFFRDVKNNIIMATTDNNLKTRFYVIDSNTLGYTIVEDVEEGHEFYLVKQAIGNTQINHLGVDSRQDYINVSDTRQVIFSRDELTITDPSEDFSIVVIDYNEETNQYEIYNNQTISNLENDEIRDKSNIFISNGHYFFAEIFLVYKSDNNIYQFFDELDGVEPVDPTDPTDPDPEEEEPEYYGSIEEAQEYFDSRNLEASEFFANLSESEKLESLYVATSVIDSNNFKGHKHDPDQYLEFPRVVKRRGGQNQVWVNSLSGGYLTTVDSCLDHEIIDPREIRYATYEMAYFLMTKSTSLYTNNEAKSSIVSSAKVDTLSVTFENNSQELTSRDVMPMIVKNYIKKYVKSSTIKRMKTKIY